MTSPSMLPEVVEALAARVERHTVTGRYDLDRDTARELNEAIAVAKGMPLTVKVGHEITGDLRMVPSRLPDFVTSLDAARTLVPKGWRIAGLFERNCRLPNWIWKAELWHPEADVNVRGIARNADLPAPALCAAALRAAALRARAAPQSHEVG
jgi:hypothetical protein